MGGSSAVVKEITYGEGSRPAVALIQVSSGRKFQSPMAALCKAIGDQIERDQRSSAVRFPKERIGELAILPCPAANKRSCAAILAKKYFSVNQFLRNIYSAMQHRELTEKECDAVFRTIEGLGANGVLEPGSGEGGVRAGCPDRAGADSNEGDHDLEGEAPGGGADIPAGDVSPSEENEEH